MLIGDLPVDAVLYTMILADPVERKEIIVSLMVGEDPGRLNYHNTNLANDKLVYAGVPESSIPNVHYPEWYADVLILNDRAHG